ncbi:MAG: energy transducer TonB [Gammaproteobacteria bacterium]|nr:energy transducer TonB [Gammaproteobacteria bacterium]MCK5262773.1 energy transducer TonB [Gammaproteobacteria bacterium]
MSTAAQSPTTPIRPPKITDNDRLGMTFFLAALLHGILILGITFSVSPVAEDKTPPTLDIILVQTQNPSEAKDAKYLAQISQQGGGNSEKKSRPRDLFTAPSVTKKPGQALQSQQQASRQKQVEKIAILHQKQSSYSIETQEQQTKPDDATIKQQESTAKSTKTARLIQEISNIIEHQIERPKVKYMNSSTKEFVPARYMREWINRVERIGNLNYPDQARRNKLNGTLILDVTINAKGELLNIDLRKSSGHKILDDAAKRIVRLAAPYPPFPAKLKQEADVIHITRSWEFMNNSEFKTQ